LTEFEEVIVEFSLFNVHDVIGDSHEIFDGLVEFGENLHNRGSHIFTFGVTNFNLLQLVELLNGASQVHDVVTAFAEGIKSNKQSVG
jgi:hypothetical protein